MAAAAALAAAVEAEEEVDVATPVARPWLFDVRPADSPLWLTRVMVMVGSRYMAGSRSSSASAADDADAADAAAAAESRCFLAAEEEPLLDDAVKRTDVVTIDFAFPIEPRSNSVKTR